MDKLNTEKSKYNNVSDKRSLLVHMSFDNPAIHTKKLTSIIYLYMMLQSRTCGCLSKNEHIDTSTRWERYAMLNIYGKYIIMRKILNQLRHHIICWTRW